LTTKSEHSVVYKVKVATVACMKYEDVCKWDMAIKSKTHDNPMTVQDMLL